jgi:uncharacterized protein YfeS
MQDDDHDPWNEPSHRHPRASELMRDDMFWDCVNELAPFGSDEGADAYALYREWRKVNLESPLTECLSWILADIHADYSDGLQAGFLIGSLEEPAAGLDYPDAFTLDATIIAVVLGQLVDEGRIDGEAKSFAYIAIDRQSRQEALSEFAGSDADVEREEILAKVRQVIEAA